MPTEFRCEAGQSESYRGTKERLDFPFLVGYMLANDRIVFLNFEFLRFLPFILSSCVEMSGFGTRHQFD